MSTHSDGRPAKAAGHCNTEVDIFIVGIVRDAEREGDGLCWGDEGRLCSKRRCNQSFISSVSTFLSRPKIEQIATKIKGALLRMRIGWLALGMEVGEHDLVPGKKRGREVLPAAASAAPRLNLFIILSLR